MIYLLVNSSIFMPAARGCYFQIVGLPMTDMKSRADSSGELVNEPESRHGNLKRKLDGQQDGQSKKSKTGSASTVPVNDFLPWSMFLYGKPVYSESGRILSTLAKNRIF
jgi:hypothetical protein